MALYELLHQLKIPYQEVSHAAVYTIEEAKRLQIDLPGVEVKNLFIKKPWILLRCSHSYRERTSDPLRCKGSEVLLVLVRFSRYRGVMRGFRVFVGRIVGNQPVPHRCQLHDCGRHRSSHGSRILGHSQPSTTLDFCWLYAPNQLCTGGFTGLAQAISLFLPKIPIGVQVLLMNLPLFFLIWKSVGHDWLV